MVTLMSTQASMVRLHDGAAVLDLNNVAQRAMVPDDSFNLGLDWNIMDTGSSQLALDPDGGLSG